MNKLPVILFFALLMQPALGLRADHTTKTQKIFLPDPRPLGKIEYINPNPPEFKEPKYPGQYYEAVVPATLDLAERARLCLHALTSMTNPNIDYEQYFTVTHMSDPPAMDHNASDMHGHGKFMEGAVLMRLMSGSRENMEVEKKWMEVTLKLQGPDGMLYTPLTGRDWILPPSMDVASGSPGYDEYKGKHFSLVGYGTARSLGALCMYAHLDPDGPWKEAARRQAQAYDKLILRKGEDKGYLFSTWYYPERPVQKPEKHPFDEYVYLAAAQAWVAQYLATYARAMDDPKAGKLAELIMNYNIFDRQVNEPSGKFKPGKGVGAGPGAKMEQYAHFHTHAMNILACAYVYTLTGNKALLENAVKAYEYGKSKSDTLVGFFPMVTYDKYVGAQTAETCQVADMVHAAVTLAKLGYDKYWDDADRWTRNQLAENQLTWTAWLTDGRLDYSRTKVPDGFFNPKQRTTDRVAERTLGAFAGWPSANDWVGAEDWEGGDKQNILYTIMNCCTGSGARGLYAAWRDSVSYDKGTLKVNLLFNRASKWADVDSYIPYTGQVDVKIKEPLNLEIRLPEWVKPADAQCKVDGKARELEFDGRYAKVGKVDKAQKVEFTFPISERTEKRKIEGFDYTFVLCGNDVVHVDPPGKYCPMYQRAHYRDGKPYYQKVERFVSDVEFPWW